MIPSRSRRSGRPSCRYGFGSTPRDQFARPLIASLVLVVVAALLAACEPAPASPTPATAGPLTSAPAAPTAAAASSTPSAVPNPSFVRPTPTPAPTYLTYTVAPGDSLTSIARRFATTPRSIAYWSRVTYPSLDPESPSYAPNRIEVGWTLSIIPGTVVDENDLPPGPASPTPLVTLPPGPTPLPNGVSLLVTHGPRTAKAVALTFDMGGRLDPAVDIVDWLVDHDVRATIFPTGKVASTTLIGQTVLDHVAAHPDLFTVGNHSWDHPDFRDLDPTAIANQLDQTETVVVDAVGRSTKPFFRPPYGGQDAGVRAAVGAAGWAYTVMWDVDTIDWKAESDGGPTAEDIVAKVLSRVQPGSIVLMHLGGWHTLEALPAIVDGLRTRGLEPVTLEELLLPR